MLTTVQIAKFLMKRWETVPTSPEIGVGELNEVFCHPIFLNGTASERRAIMLKSSESKYKDEVKYPWDHYFDVDLSPFLQGKKALDLGCFTGGRSVAWFERYKLRHLVGIDVEQSYIDAARQFAAIKKVHADFEVAKGEVLPLGDETVDAILSFDVFEHVQDVQRTLNECYRVLRTGGRLFVVFPSYFQPIEHHLSLVTKFPGIHYFFTGKALVNAYCEILEERGSDAYWYNRRSPRLESWERGNAINGTTLARFKKYLKSNSWKTIAHSKKPIGSVGRNISNRKLLHAVSKLFYPLTLVPGIQEIFLHRITYVLEKVRVPARGV
jgi:ubiquinone/menaquinone biosynthesis C-methylase UbiE